MVNILVFGDSVAYGAWDREGGWVRRLRNIIENTCYKNVEAGRYDQTTDAPLIYNLGIPDHTTNNLLSSFKSEIKVRLWQDDTVIIMIGKNDAILENATQTLAVPPEKFEANLKKLIQIAKQYAKYIVLVETLPVDDKRVDPIPWLPTHSYKNEYVAQYNDIIRKVSKQEGIALVEIYSKLINTDFEKLLEDGVHPNSEGHQWVCNQVKNYLLKSKIIKA